MKFIISPAKKMNTDTDTFAVRALPVFLEDTRKLLAWIQGQTYDELKKLWKCNDKIARQNYERFREMELHQNVTPALISYEGIQYQYMAPMVFSRGAWEYVQEHLRILSGFYGVLRPLDGVRPYRLEMQARADFGGAPNLYDFWGDRLYREVVDADRVIINLASKEYSRCIENYLEPEDTFITCIFGEYKDGRVIQKGTQAKMARGEMVRFAAERQIEAPEQLKAFDGLGYRFCEAQSDAARFVFLKEDEKM